MKAVKTEANFEGYGGLNSFRISNSSGVLAMRKLYPIVSITIGNETHVLPAKALLLNLNILLENALSDDLNKVRVNFASVRWLENAIVLVTQGIKIVEAAVKKLAQKTFEETHSGKSATFEMALRQGKYRKVWGLYNLFMNGAVDAGIHVSAEV